MKLKIKYATNKTGHFRLLYKEICAESLKISRVPCGTGAASNRYYYRATFIAPDDAIFVDDGLITEGIDRKKNPQFKPKNFNWIDNIASVKND